MIIYLVIGSRGQYSDHQEWPITAFKDKEGAIKLVDSFPDLLKKVNAYYMEASEWYKDQCIANGAWNKPTNPNWSQVRGAIWDEKRKKEIEVEKLYLGAYLSPKNEDDKNYPQEVPTNGVHIVEVELV